MEGNNQMYQMPQNMMVPPPMMQGFQPPLPFNPMTQQQLSLLMMSSYARLMALIQLMNTQIRYQLYQPNQYSDPGVNNYSPVMPVPLPYVQPPQVDLQNELQNEMFQKQQEESQKLAESKKQTESQEQVEKQQGEELQPREILDERKIQSEFDMEIERREILMKRKAEEEELEIQQKELERLARDEEEIKRQQEEAKKQILEEEQKEREQKERDMKLREEEELKCQKVRKLVDEKVKENLEKWTLNQEKMKENQANVKPKGKVMRRPSKKNCSKKITEEIISRL